MLRTIPTVFDTKRLNALVDGFPANAIVSRSESIVTVSAPNGTKVLSAASRNGRHWHVMADPRIVKAAA